MYASDRFSSISSEDKRVTKGKEEQSEQKIRAATITAMNRHSYKSERVAGNEVKQWGNFHGFLLPNAMMS